MKQILLWMLAVGVWCAACAKADAEEEYLLRVNVMEYEYGAEEIIKTQSFSELMKKLPNEKLLRGVEMVVVPGERFYCKTRQGGHTQTVLGMLTEEDGKFNIQVDYLHTYDDGRRVPVLDDGTRVPVLHKFGVRGSLSLKVGEEGVLGGSLVERKKETCQLLLTRFETPDDSKPSLPLMKDFEKEIQDHQEAGPD
jgi:hypothetical protein